MSKQLVTELRELHTSVGGAIEIIDLLVEEGSEVLLKEWATNLFKMAIEIEIRAALLGRVNRPIIITVEETDYGNSEGPDSEAEERGSGD